jgi:hypothetical protein
MFRFNRDLNSRVQWEWVDPDPGTTDSVHELAESILKVVKAMSRPNDVGLRSMRDDYEIRQVTNMLKKALSFPDPSKVDTYVEIVKKTLKAYKILEHYSATVAHRLLDTANEMAKVAEKRGGKNVLSKSL